MIVQIYEIQTPNEAEKCIEIGVDHLGSVILSKDEWCIPTLKEAMGLTQGTDSKNSLIPLFQESEILYKALDYYRPTFVHFCNNLTDEQGHETDLGPFIQYQSRLKEKFPQIGIIRSVPVPRKRAWPEFPVLKIALAFQPVSDILLIDTWLGKEPVKGYVGITGKTPDWDMARNLVIQGEIPVILGGGLSPTNVYEGIMKVLPAGADSCTGTNMKDGEGKPIRFRKDFQKVAQFVKEVRRAEEKVRLRKNGLLEKLMALKSELMERELALPPHSVRPHQLMAVEALEDKITQTEKELRNYEKILTP